MDLYSFRQTQTALTAFWMMKDGFHFAYETPVAGAPWSIPFEFPIYQWIVALIAGSTGWSLTAVGRVVSFIFLVLCLFPVRSIVRVLRLDAAVLPIFAALLFSSPLYLYWGRTFMIETAGVFFVVVSLRYFVEIITGSASMKNSVLFVIFMTLGVLQKATTGLPVLAVLGLIYLVLNLRALFFRFDGPVSKRNSIVVRRAILAALYVGIPLFVGVAWTFYTDRVKVANPLGVSLTSSALSFWNWGTLAQRFSSDLYSIVFWQRIIFQNLAGFLGLALFAMFFGSSLERRVKWVVGLSLAIAVVPLFLFSNLHIVHTYYQTANVIFAIFALAVCVAYLRSGWRLGRVQALILLVLLVGSNYWQFSNSYLRATEEEFSVGNNRHLAVGQVLKKEIPDGKGFVAFGNDWSSSMAFFAERKSFTVPPFMKDYAEKSKNPENFMAVQDLGGVVLCADIAQPKLGDLMRWASTKDGWKVGQVHGCYMAFPGGRPAAAAGPVTAVEGQCQGAIDSAAPALQDANVLAVNGWVLAKDAAVSNGVFVYLEQAGAAPIYMEALRLPRPDVNEALKQPMQNYSGFSRVLDTASLHGSYRVGVARTNGASLERCGFHKEVSFP